MIFTNPAFLGKNEFEKFDFDWHKMKPSGELSTKPPNRILSYKYNKGSMD
jgi:hypothetical protein